MGYDFSVSSNLNWNRNVAIAIALRRVDQPLLSASPIQFSLVHPGELIEPAINLTPEEATRLMDELWRAGVRPSSGEGNVGQIGAIQAHLADMRRLVFMENLEPLVPRSSK
jgi:hypothetical protein